MCLPRSRIEQSFARETLVSCWCSLSIMPIAVPAQPIMYHRRLDTLSKQATHRLKSLIVGWKISNCWSRRRRTGKGCDKNKFAIIIKTHTNNISFGGAKIAGFCCVVVVVVAVAAFWLCSKTSSTMILASVGQFQFWQIYIHIRSPS